MNKPIKSEIMLVTPATARDLLKLSRNRPIRQKNVARVCGWITRGEWRGELLPPGVTINPEGYVNGGQHRLLAILRLGVTLPMFITYNFPDEASRLVDTSATWSLSDQTGVLPKHMGALRILYNIVEPARDRPTNAQMAPFIEAFLPALRELDTANPRTLAIAPSRAAAVLCAVDRDRSYALLGYSRMVTRKLLELMPVQVAYYNWMQRQKNITGAAFANEVFCRGLIAFDSAFSQRRVLGLSSTSLPTHLLSAQTRIIEIVTAPPPKARMLFSRVL